ncbi:MAG: N-6 DNA methylase, partial [Thermoproteota archaeon]
MDINPIIPANFEEKLKTYLRTIRQKEGEYNKRNYFVNEVLVKWFNIDPELIDFEASRRDLFVAGVLFETKIQLNEQKRKEAFKELKKYIKTKHEDTIKAVVTDFIQFEIYDPKDIENYTEKQYENIFKKCKGSFSLDSGDITLEEHFQNLYKLLYSHDQLLPISERVIVPRLVYFINQLSKQAEEIKTDNIKFKAWSTYLSIALGSEKEANIDLFRKYVILYYITILFVAKLLGYKANRDSIISGDIFIAKGIRNFVDQEDFFNVLDTKSKILDEIDEELGNYNFQKISNRSDIFRLLYEELISPSDRHSLGEFYTPEWLAKYIIDEIVTKDNLVLDPACGSGTFLRASIKKKKELGSENIEKQIIGFDINPIAVIIAKANILLEFRKGIEIIPVFLADSLMPDLNIKQKRLQEDCININFEEIVEGAGTAEFYYKPNGKDLSPQEMYDYIKRLMDLAEEKSKGIDITEKIESDMLPNQGLIEKLSELISKGKNHLWSFILQNIYNPYYYRGKVDVVIGNPPWLTYKDVESPSRQHFLDNLYLEYGLGGGSENKTHQDMAEFFIARAKEYIRKNDKGEISDTGKIGFVLTRAIFDSAQYNAIRRAAVSANKGPNNSNDLPRITKIYDITQKANPFRRTSCIVIFDFKNTSDEIDGVIIDSEKKVKINEPPKIIETKTKFYINITKNESGIVVSKLRNNNLNSSIYKDEFKQGATIVPRPYYFVEIE